MDPLQRDDALASKLRVQEFLRKHNSTPTSAPVSAQQPPRQFSNPSASVLGAGVARPTASAALLPDDLEADLAKMHLRLYGSLPAGPPDGITPIGAAPQARQHQQPRSNTVYVHQAEHQQPPPQSALPPQPLVNPSMLERPSRPRVLDWVVTQAEQQTPSVIEANPAIPGDEMHHYTEEQQLKHNNHHHHGGGDSPKRRRGRSPRRGEIPPEVIHRGKKKRKQPDGSTEMDPLTGAWNDSTVADTAVIPDPEEGHAWLDQHQTFRHTAKELEMVKDRFKNQLAAGRPALHGGSQYTAEKKEEASHRRDRRRARTPCGPDGWMIGATGSPHYKGPNRNPEDLTAKELMERMNHRTPSPRRRSLSPVFAKDSAGFPQNAGNSQSGAGLTSKASTTVPSSYGTSKLDQVKCRVPTRFVKKKKPPTDAGLLTPQDWERIQVMSATPWSDIYS